MTVTEILTLGEYYKDPRFVNKRPDFESQDLRMWMGDNFYEPSGKGFIQHVSAHNIEGRDREMLIQKKNTDLSGVNVLISNLFFYYGDNSQPLPSDLDFLKVGRGHKLSGTKGLLTFERIAENLIKEPGIHGEPRTLTKESQRLKYLHLRHR